LTDKEREEIDANAKQLLRELNHAVKGLSDTEQLRQDAERAIALKKRARHGLGMVGRWAAGGAITAKSPEELLEEAKANTIKVHRESIIWYLRRQLEECGRFQSSMMEVRLAREVEKSKSILYNARITMPGAGEYKGANGGLDAANGYRGKSTAQQDEESKAAEQQLDPEQLQLFAQENQDMLKHYEDTLDQVRYVCILLLARRTQLTTCLEWLRSRCSRFPNFRPHWLRTLACKRRTLTSSWKTRI
jgi:hypothetical protein